MGREEVVVDREGMREDLLGWNIKEVTKLALSYDSAFQILVELLEDKNPMVRANALQVIKEMIGSGTLTPKRTSMVIDKIIKLTKDDSERVALKALEVLNSLLERGELREEEYDKVTEALMDIVKRGMPILSEYASEGLGKTGASVLRIARKLIGWLFNLIRSSEDRQVQSAAISALAEMAHRTEDRKIFNEIVDKTADLLEHTDPYVQERALLALDRMSTRADMMTKRNRLKVLKKVKEVQGNIKLASKANLLLEKLEKLEGEELTEKVEVRKKLEVSEYGPDDVERLLDAGRADIVAEMAKLDPMVMSQILEMLNSEDPTRKMDALWVLSRVVSHLTPTDAYSVLPTLGELLKSRNPWTRETAAETMAEIYALYPGTAGFFTSLLDVLLKSNRPADVEGALELISAIQKKMPTEEFNRAIIDVLSKLISRKETRGVALRFLARESQRLLEMEPETLLALENTVKSVYGREGGKYDNIIAALVDAIDDIIRLKAGEGTGRAQ
ncbi:HEAT repeat domain-containing protein [Thermococcus sp. Bubb.Bath]|uniref:HEAT repeat domain-containing protein n=1 Tax=Thermococcus sp. Bubb.Bath TaxID=1638242 RepID=UPI00143AA28D|nr:HEAT repeat domain-containing protein [Thermococcus sp. Bubb.Bath]NJF25693.1 hypothetical protein [Thermococcus sp. Bubb.Bath]